MIKIVKIPLLLSLALLVSCSPGSGPLGNIECGQSLSKAGSITDTSTRYQFRPYTKSGTAQDLFNHIYFLGDTFCFSLEIEQGYDRNSLHVSFTDPATGTNVIPERIDYHRERISGFSLVGTLMEQFHNRELLDPIPPGMYCCKNYPVVITVTYVKDSRIVTQKKKCNFTFTFN